MIYDHDLIEKAALAAGVMPVAISDILARAAEFEVKDDKVVVKATGLGIDSLREASPHYFKLTVDDLAERAFGPTPSLSAQGEFFRLHGDFRAREMAKEFGTTLGSLKPGKLPAGGDDKGKTNGADHAKNPFHKSNWNVTKQAQLVKSIGIEKAAAIAKAVGVTIGQTKPNLNY